MRNKALNKKIYIICGSFLAILLVFVVGIAIKKLNYEKNLLSEGIRTEAQVINKYHLKTNTGKIKKSYIELAVFEDTTAVAKQKSTEVEKEPKSINDKIDNLFDDFGTKKTPTENYKSITVLTGLEQFGATKIGEWKTYVYLKSDVEDGMLLEAIE